MPLVVNQNIPAITAYGNLATTRENLSKAIEKFSTGLRINSAADDAAGLAVSEKLRAQMGGIDQAIDNVQDGISLIQTADGALSETQDILHRMRELSVQSANGTLTAQDRSYIQFEINELREEITRIANTTQFNKKKLLNGEAAAHWSSDKTTTKAIIRGGLQDVDEFGQKISFEGNYKIDIEAIPGQGAVMKTKIFTSLEDVGVFTYVGSGNYRDNEDNSLTASEAAMALDGQYFFNLVNKKNGKVLSVGLEAEAGQFSSMAQVAKALNKGDLKDTEYMAYFDPEAGALAIRSLGHDFNVTGSEHDVGKLFGVNSNLFGTGDGSEPTLDVVIPTIPTIPDPPSVDQPSDYAAQNANGDFVVDITDLTYKQTYADDNTAAPIEIRESGVYKISGKHGNITVAEGVKATIVMENVTVKNLNDQTTANPNYYGNAAFVIGKDAEVDLALVGYTELTSGNGRAGIEVEETSTLRVYDNTQKNGKLKVTGGYYGAAIGGSGNLEADPRDESPAPIQHNAGNIIIYSGNITANATTRWRNGNDYGLENPDYPYGYDDFGGAGIGGGRYGTANYIAIHGGTVTAEGSFGGAAIGSGRIGYPGQESAANILITGGTVKATAHAGGAGIGGGSGSEYIRTRTSGGYEHNEFVYLENSTPSYGKIVITGGTITATGGDGGYNNRGGAAIGGGEYNFGGEILITGGTITANGGPDGGAGIGGGTGGPNVDPRFGQSGKIYITGGDITATGGSGWASAAGIGGGNRSTADEIVITGGKITATGGNNVTGDEITDWANGGGAGIGAGSGSGYHENGNLIVGGAGNVYILGGEITATGGFDAAGIGDGGTDQMQAGDTGMCPSSGGQIVIAGGDVTAQGGVSGAGIGGGNRGQSGVIRIQEGLTVNAKAGGNNFFDETGQGMHYGRTPSEGFQEDIGHGDHIRGDSDVEYVNIRLIDSGGGILTPPSRGRYTETVQRIAEPDTPLSTLLELQTDAGEPLLKDPQTITINRGDGTQSRFTLYPDDDMNSLAQKLNTAIAGALGSTGSTGYQSGALVGQTGPNTSGGASARDVLDHFASYVAPGENIGYTSESVEGTMLIRSLPCGIDGELAFVGSKEVLEALGFNTIQEARENQFIVNITDAHTGEVVAKNVRVMGNKLNGVLHKNVDIEWDAMAGIEVKWNDDTKMFEYSTSKYTTYLHLADDTMVLQVGANEGEDLALSIGDMSAHALGLDAVNVMGRESAARAITLIDNANDKVSTQRARLGAYQNRLERTIGSLSTASVNLTQADSRIRDTDMAREAMNFAKLQIIFQSGTSMLTQANQLPQHVMSLMR